MILCAMVEIQTYIMFLFEYIQVSPWGRLQTPFRNISLIRIGVNFRKKCLNVPIGLFCFNSLLSERNFEILFFLSETFKDSF